MAKTPMLQVQTSVEYCRSPRARRPRYLLCPFAQTGRRSKSMRNVITPAGFHLAIKRVAFNVTARNLPRSTNSLKFCLQDCAEYVHEDNRRRGWWTDLYTGKPKQRNVGELLMLMVSELAEV